MATPVTRPKSGVARQPADMVVAGAASTVLAPVLTAPPRAAWILGANAGAAYIATQDPTLPVAALLSTTAIRVSNGILVAARPPTTLFAALTPGETITIGDGHMRCSGLTVRVARWWVPRRPQIRDARSAESHARELAKLVDQAAAPLPGYLTEPHRALAAAITDGDTAAAEAAAVAMLGLGPGLTPSGDDILAGALVTLRALVELEPAVSSLADGVAATVVRAATRRTSLVSAALLHEAAAGRCIPELTSLLDALGSGSPLDHRVAALLRVGHTSGSDLARGVLLALATAAKRSNSC